MDGPFQHGIRGRVHPMTTTVPVRLVCWNIEHKHAPWRMLRGMDADVALLDAATAPGRRHIP